jgi:hypothetical protein
MHSNSWHGSALASATLNLDPKTYLSLHEGALLFVK